MSTKSSIEWTQHTWNPVTGCSKVSPGCAHCYAETVALRFWPSQYPPVEYETYSVDNCCTVKEMRVRAFTDVQCHADRLAQPLRRRTPTTYFVNSMSDLFHEDVPDDFIKSVFTVMAIAKRHTFQILTKRSERMRALVSSWRADDMYDFWFEDIPERGIFPTGHDGFDEVDAWPLPNVWLGVSVENQHFADERIPRLLQTPAAVRFISAEPLLKPINLKSFMPEPLYHCPRCGKEKKRTYCAKCRTHDNTATNELIGLDWVIVGGESGRGARMCHTEWIAAIVKQCQAAGVACFVKQLGADPRWGPDGWKLDMLRDRKGGDIAEWPNYYVGDLKVRQFPLAAADPSAPHG